MTSQIKIPISFFNLPYMGLFLLSVLFSWNMKLIHEDIINVIHLMYEKDGIRGMRL
ncbi:hypothetical protein LguiB_009486 [Lonicera macranthoides]